MSSPLSIGADRSSTASICEWRGHDEEEFSDYLIRVYIRSCYAIIGVLVVYAIIFYFLYLIYKYRSKAQLEAFLKTYEYQLKISNLDVTNINFANS